MTRVVAVAAALVISLCSLRRAKCDARPAVAKLAPASCFYSTFNLLFYSTTECAPSFDFCFGRVLNRKQHFTSVVTVSFSLLLPWHLMFGYPTLSLWRLDCCLFTRHIPPLKSRPSVLATFTCTDRPHLLSHQASL